MHKFKHKPTDVGRIALERQAGAKTFDPNGILTIDLPLHNQMHYRQCYLALTIATVTNFILATRVRAVEITQK